MILGETNSIFFVICFFFFNNEKIFICCLIIITKTFLRLSGIPVHCPNIPVDVRLPALGVECSQQLLFRVEETEAQRG